MRTTGTGLPIPGSLELLHLPAGWTPDDPLMQKPYGAWRLRVGRKLYGQLFALHLNPAEMEDFLTRQFWRFLGAL